MIDDLRALAGGAGGGRARRAPGRSVTVGDYVDHPVDRFVVEDLVESAEPASHLR
jgi:hypothetical protein